MAGSVNKVILIGNVGKKPEIRATQNGSKLATFSIATGKRWKDKETQEYKDKTEWHNIVVFGDGLVDIVEKYVKKGSKIYVEGELQTRKWQDKDGNDRWTTEVLGNQLTMLGSRGTSEQSSDANNSSDAPFPEDDSGPGLTDDDIPF